MDDLTKALFILAWIIIFVPIYYYRRKKRRSKEIYGFDLPGWKNIEDTTLLYEIELLFRQGLVADALKKYRYAIDDWHSNQYLVGAPTQTITGFMSTKQFQMMHVMDENPLDMDFAYGFSNHSSFRFYWGKLQTPLSHLTLLGSSDLGRGLPPSVMKAQPYIAELDQLFGLNAWTFIGYQKDLVILVPEIFEAQLLSKFLELSQNIRQALG